MGSEYTQERRAALLEAARGVFLRYGFKKTSMDDLARAANISRQGLYLHFATKEALFREVVTQVVVDGQRRISAALARDDLPAEERLFGAFEAGSMEKPEGTHVSELLETSQVLLGDVIEDVGRTVAQDLTRAIKSSGVAASWEKTGISARALAEHLQAVSDGLKHRASTRADYLERMRVAVRIVCRGGRK
ncbi:MAG: TetR/AcrR family transcriptional regulator [Polyangiales bacterium]